ncbi:Beclin-1 [Wickerhamomyces ciferrii]|uniref:Beclin-1 n=1 Tax=Wickerhamomyces ciferrii (strain ATCC 14091 / BCRC 22168 / CBS 111 / JCM 3599 / NBRC 0793 / NRRL Y-1031 F-60-10) TaxID=1206466 RepID=K0KNU5_WICCF|nr:Beclin-1 [Wickerhamomyces ciferrii]CCH43847.1 Beclin-1 [Wickerhamomyces ciferrii]
MSPTNHCHRCKLPIIIDPSLINLTKAQSSLLTSGRNGFGKGNSTSKETELGDEPFIPKERSDLLQKATQSSKNQAQFPKKSYEATDSFVILSQFENDESEENGVDSDIDIDNKTLSNRLNTLSNIFNVLSSKNEIDYPVCKDCAQLLLTQLKIKYDKSVKEREVYMQFLSKLQDKQAPVVEKSQESIDEMNKLANQENELLEELKALEKENDDLDDEIKTVTEEIKNIDLQEQQMYKEENEKELEIRNVLNEKDAIKAEYDFNVSQLEKLRKTNVYNDTFNISHDGPFGTINGLRLGSLESTKVPWQEINAALGHLVLLMATVSARLNFKLQGYKLKPMGSTSKIEKFERDLSNPSKPKVTVLEVYSSGEYQIERLFTHSKLDNALVALLEIVSQIANKLKELDPSIDLPYKMIKDKIGDASIRLSSKTASEEWTGACKFLLTK